MKKPVKRLAKLTMELTMDQQQCCRVAFTDSLLPFLVLQYSNGKTYFCLHLNTYLTAFSKKLRSHQDVFFKTWCSVYVA